MRGKDSFLTPFRMAWGFQVGRERLQTSPAESSNRNAYLRGLNNMQMSTSIFVCPPCLPFSQPVSCVYADHAPSAVISCFTVADFQRDFCEFSIIFFANSVFAVTVFPSEPDQYFPSAHSFSILQFIYAYILQLHLSVHFSPYLLFSQRLGKRQCLFLSTSAHPSVSQFPCFSHAVFVTIHQLPLIFCISANALSLCITSLSRDFSVRSLHFAIPFFELHSQNVFPSVHLIPTRLIPLVPVQLFLRLFCPSIWDVIFRAELCRRRRVSCTVHRATQLHRLQSGFQVCVFWHNSASCAWVCRCFSVGHAGGIILYNTMDILDYPSLPHEVDNSSSQSTSWFLL